jgi:hypothetical protein
MSAYPPQPPYGAQPPQPQQQTSSKAIIALVMGILAWTTCPIILAIPALIFASQARAEIDSSNGWVTGDGLVTASRWLGWLNIILWGLGALAFVAIFAIAIIFGETSTMSDVTPNTIPEF